MSKKRQKCPNCEFQFQFNFQFCPQCGQKSNEDLTLKVLFYNTISNYFSVDARFFKSFIPLLFKPGFLASQFVQGKRLMYLHPAQFYLFVTVVFFFLFSFISRHQEQQLDALLSNDFEQKQLIKPENTNRLTDSLIGGKIDSVLVKSKLNNAINDSNYNLRKKEDLKAVSYDFDTNEVDSLISIKAPESDILRAMGLKKDANFITQKFYAQILKFYKQKGGGILSAFYDTIPMALFILLPIFAFILKLMFYKTGFYAHHLVFSFYFFSFLFTLLSLLVLVNYLITLPNWLNWVLALSTFVYLFVAIKQFYKKTWKTSVLKSALATFIYFVFVIPIAFVLIAFSAFMFY